MAGKELSRSLKKEQEKMRPPYQQLKGRRRYNKWGAGVVRQSRGARAARGPERSEDEMKAARRPRLGEEELFRRWCRETGPK